MVREDADKAATAKPGDGVRSIKTTNVFRAVNFELYVKPNRVVMAAGVAAIAGCSAYLLYMRRQALADAQLVRLDDDSTAVIRKVSNWEI